MVGNNANVQRWVRCLEDAGHRHKVAGAVSHRAGLASCLCYRRGSGKTLCNVERIGVIHAANRPVHAAGLPAWVIQLAASMVYVLDAGEFAVKVVQRHHQPAVPCDSCPVWLDTLAL